MTDTLRCRKQGHIREALKAQEVQQVSPLDAIRLRHCALPDVDLEAVDLQTEFLGFHLGAPILISSMTGGTETASQINLNLARAAGALQLPMGVGSQRILLERGRHEGFDRRLRQAMGPQGLLLANVGAVNLPSRQPWQAIEPALEAIDANALIVHLNPMQEAFQFQGDHCWKAVRDRLQALLESAPVPVVVKEVGQGLDAATGRWLAEQGAAALDLAGQGGTDFLAIEARLHPDARQRQRASIFSGWGYTTADLLEMYHQAALPVPLIASGGLRHGLDVARCLAAGATLAGFAGGLLAAATESDRSVQNLIEEWLVQLRIACFGCGVSASRDLGRQHCYWQTATKHSSVPTA